MNKAKLQQIKNSLLYYAGTESTDPVTKVAAAVFKDRHTMLYAVNKIDPCLPTEEVIARTNLFYRNIKHAEYNLIIKLGCPKRINKPIFTTCFPCIDCQKILMERGVKKVYYIDDHFDKEWSVEAHKFAEETPIKYIKF